MSLKNILDRLDLNPVAAHLELRVYPTQEVQALSPAINFTAIARAIKATKLWVGNKLLGRLLGKITIAAREVDPTDAKLARFTMNKRAHAISLENDIGNVG